AARVDHGRQEIAPYLVGPEEVPRRSARHPGRRQEPCPDVYRERIVRRDPGREDGACDDQQHHGGRAESPPEPTEPLPRRRGLRRASAGELLELDPRLCAERHQASTRIRGSISPTIMSTTKLTATIMRASSTTAHCTTGKS